MKTLRDIDDKITCIINDYETIDNYHYYGSCATRIKGIRIPTMFMFAEDDYIIGKDSIDFGSCY